MVSRAASSMQISLLRPQALPFGLFGAVLVMLGSFGGGAIRNRGGVLNALGLDFLSYGHGAGISNMVLWLGTVVFVVAWVLLGRQVVFNPELAPQQRCSLVRKALVCWLVPFVCAAPIMSRDVYSYLMQGAMVRDGFDPYTQGAAVNPGPMLLEVSHDWRNTTTPYGPLHLWIGERITRLVGDNVTLGIVLYKAVSVLGFLAIMWSIPRLAQALGGSPATALWIGVANPLIVFHLIGGMHNESVMVGLVSIGLLFSVRRWFVLGVALVAVAVSLKATAAIALPFIVWLATQHWSRGSKLRFWPFIAAGAAAVLETVAIVSAITWASGSSWGWIAEISGNSKVINPLALPSLLAGMTTDFVRLFNNQFDYNVPLEWLRSACMVLMLVILVVVWWLFRRTPAQAVRGVAAAYAVAFVFNAVTLPWYYASLVSLIGVTAVSRTALRWATGLSIVVTMAFTGSGNHQLYNLAWMSAFALAAWGLSALALRVDRPSSQDEACQRVTGGVEKQEPTTPSPAPGA